MAARSNPSSEGLVGRGWRILLVVVAVAVAGGTWWYQHRGIEPGGQVVRATIRADIPRPIAPSQPPSDPSNVNTSLGSTERTITDKPAQTELKPRPVRVQARLVP